MTGWKVSINIFFFQVHVGTCICQDIHTHCMWADPIEFIHNKNNNMQRTIQGLAITGMLTDVIFMDISKKPQSLNTIKVTIHRAPLKAWQLQGWEQLSFLWKIPTLIIYRALDRINVIAFVTPYQFPYFFRHDFQGFVYISRHF